MVVSVSCDVVTSVSCRWLSLSARTTVSRISSAMEAVSRAGPPGRHGLLDHLLQPVADVARLLGHVRAPGSVPLGQQRVALQ